MFYLTLPSNSSLNFYPSNTLTHYTTVLAQDVDLNGQWEVGLSEIQYPRSWQNIQKNNCWINVYCNETLQETLNVPHGQYDTPEQLIAGLNQLFTPAPPPYTATDSSQDTGHIIVLTQPAQTQNQERSVVFNYHSVAQKVTIEVLEAYTIELSPTLQYILGMEENSLNDGKHQGSHVVDVHQGFYSLYVYCNLIEPWLVGDTRASLLRIVPIEGHGHQMITKTYQHIQYLPLGQKHFRTIEIDIKKDTGEKVPFEVGKLVVTLHFRKRKPNL